MTNRIIVPANFTIDVIIRLDPVNGQSDLQIRNRSKSNLTMWQIVGLLTEHAAHVTRMILSGKVKLTPSREETLEETQASLEKVQ